MILELKYNVRWGEIEARDGFASLLRNKLFLGRKLKLIIVLCAYHPIPVLSLVGFEKKIEDYEKNRINRY